MFEAAHIREWRGHYVVDAERHKIGELEVVYIHTGTDLPSLATVKVGMPTRHRLVFVPLDQAMEGPGYLKVCYARKQVKDARRSAPTASCRWAAKRRSLSTTAWHTSRAPSVSGGWPAAQQPPERRTR